MRLRERDLVTIRIAPRVCVKGALGSVSAGFGERKAVRASVLPENRAISIRESGLASGAALRIIIPKDTAVSEGDGVWLNGEAYTVSSVCRWRAHAELTCAKML